jgi:hypothetical protein
MNMMMLPKMLSSHDGGWEWLMRMHPSVAKVFTLYVMPMALIPPAMILYAVSAYGEQMLSGVSMAHAWRIAVLFYVCELVAVPVMAGVIQRLGEVVDARPEYHDAFAFASVVPTPLWLSPLALFIPSLTLMGVVMAVALFVSGLLIYEGNYRVFRLDDEGKSRLLASAVLGAGLVGWVALMVLAFVSWGWAVS